MPSLLFSTNISATIPEKQINSTKELIGDTKSRIGKETKDNIDLGFGFYMDSDKNRALISGEGIMHEFFLPNHLYRFFAIQL